MRWTVRILLLVLLQLSGSCGQRPKKTPKQPEDLLEKIKLQENFSLSQFAGKWFLIGVASECDYLKENNHRVEATIILVSPTVTEKKALPVSTFRKMDGICWQIKQEYQETKVSGRFLLKVRGYKSNLDVLVGDTDYSSYAILYYQKQRKISVKLYARSANVGDAILDRYEQRISELGIAEDFTYYFPKYGFCDSADQFHILNA